MLIWNLGVLRRVPPTLVQQFQSSSPANSSRGYLPVPWSAGVNTHPYTSQSGTKARVVTALSGWGLSWDSQHWPSRVRHRTLSSADSAMRENPSIQEPEPRPFLCCFFPSVTLQDQGLHNTPCTHCRVKTNARVKTPSAVGEKSEIPEQTLLVVSCHGLSDFLCSDRSTMRSNTMTRRSGLFRIPPAVIYSKNK